MAWQAGLGGPPHAGDAGCDPGPRRGIGRPDISTRPTAPYARNATRALKPETFVAIGFCTHLGCSPNTVPAGTANPSLATDWPGGFLCACHDSTFDGAGRVFKNKPTPTNLKVPPYQYASEPLVLIGDFTG